jgi:hypothetical protein
MHRIGVKLFLEDRIRPGGLSTSNLQTPFSEEVLMSQKETNKTKVEPARCRTCGDDLITEVPATGDGQCIDCWQAEYEEANQMEELYKAALSRGQP